MGYRKKLASIYKETGLDFLDINKVEEAMYLYYQFMEQRDMIKRNITKDNMLYSSKIKAKKNFILNEGVISRFRSMLLDQTSLVFKAKNYAAVLAVYANKQLAEGISEQEYNMLFNMSNELLSIATELESNEKRKSYIDAINAKDMEKIHALVKQREKLYKKQKKH